MKAASGQSVAGVAKTEGFTNSYFTLLLRIATLSPCIVQAIIDGRQPASLTRQRPLKPGLQILAGESMPDAAREHLK